MKYIDYYKVLDVPRTATAEEISKAYKRLARKYHPDINKSSQAEAKFKELNVNEKFFHKNEQYIKVEEFTLKQKSCCNFTRNTKVNAKKRDGQYVYFDDKEEIVLKM